MWQCPTCKREFAHEGQMHSCRSIPKEDHFKNKALALELYELLLRKVNKEVGECREVSLPCCIHWVGKYDFVAVLPHKDSLEVRFAYPKVLEKKEIFASVPLSAKAYKLCVSVTSEKDITEQLVGWLKESYHLKDEE